MLQEKYFAMQTSKVQVVLLKREMFCDFLNWTFIIDYKKTVSHFVWFLVFRENFDSICAYILNGIEIKYMLADNVEDDVRDIKECQIVHNNVI